VADSHSTHGRLVDAGVDSAFELRKLIDLSDHEVWYDVEDDRFVGEDLRPFLRLSRKAWLLRSPKASLTLDTTPLGHHTIGSTNIMMETLNAYQRSQGPTLYLNRWTRTVEERVRKTSLNLKWICYWLSKSKKSCRRLLLPALYVLTVTLLSHRALKFTSRGRRRQRRRVIAAVPPTVTTRMTMMTTTTIKSVIAMKVYDLPNDVSFLPPMMVLP
jgi:hypothetical protein